MRFHVGIVRVGETHRLHRAKTKRFTAPLCHNFDGQASFEIRRVFLPVAKLGLLTSDQRVNEGVVLVFIHGAIDVGRCVAARTGLVIAALAPGFAHIDRVEIDDWRDGIKESEIVFASVGANGFRKLHRRQRPGRHDDTVPVFGRDIVDSFAYDGHVRVRFERRGDVFGKPFAINREGAACGDLMLAALGDDQPVRAPHLLMQDADRIRGVIIGPERVRADELGQLVSLVGFSAAHAAHFVYDDGNAHIGGLPGSFGAGHSAADDVDRFDAHERRCAPVCLRGQGSGSDRLSRRRSLDRQAGAAKRSPCRTIMTPRTDPQ